MKLFPVKVVSLSLEQNMNIKRAVIEILETRVCRTATVHAFRHISQ